MIYGNTAVTYAICNKKVKGLMHSWVFYEIALMRSRMPRPVAWSGAGSGAPLRGFRCAKKKTVVLCAGVVWTQYAIADYQNRGQKNYQLILQLVFPCLTTKKDTFCKNVTFSLIRVDLTTGWARFIWSRSLAWGFASNKWRFELSN